ncbi:MAG: hypothetical protein M1818_001044 [Claussenomyces sp. TS43310]|nr:MAG: hypothetical protein M1818_001044 [Claussenomyces sp. TS43310]
MPRKDAPSKTRSALRDRPRGMAASVKALLKNARQTVTGAGIPATPIEELFPKVDPAVDGDDCNHDCGSCSVKYPRGFNVEMEDDLYGHVDGWSTHVLVATGKTDWVKHVEDEKGSVMEAFGRSVIKPSNGNLKLSASNIPTPTLHNDYAEPTTVLLLPAFTVIENVTPTAVPDLIRTFIDTAPTNTTPLNAPSIPRFLPDSPASNLMARPSPHRALILLCSQRTRDARCGQSAPLLRKELERHLRPLGLFRDLDDERPGGVGIYFISHVGGHKYSANMMIYRRPNPFGLDDLQRAKVDEEVRPLPQTQNAEAPGEEASQCIWLARVRPEDCEGIIKYTVLQGKLIQPERQLRGGFDRQKGVFSW